MAPITAVPAGKRQYPVLLGVAWGSVFGFICGLIMGIVTGTLIYPGVGTAIGLIGAFIVAPFVGALCGLFVGIAVWIAPSKHEAQQYSALLLTFGGLVIPVAGVMLTNADWRGLPAVTMATVHFLTFTYWSSREIVDLLYRGPASDADNRWYAPSRRRTIATGLVTGVALSASIWLFYWVTQR